MGIHKNNSGTGRFTGTAKDPKFVANMQRFHKFKTAGTLYNNGPITSGGGTSFGTDRWKSYLDSLNAEQAKVFTKETGLKKGQTTKDFVETQTKIIGKELFWDEGTPQSKIDKDIADYEKSGPYVGANADGLSFKDTTPGLKNKPKLKLKTEGMLKESKGVGLPEVVKTVSDSSGVEHPASIANRYNDGTNQNDAQTAINKKAINEKWKKVNDAIAAQKKKNLSIEATFGGVKDRLADILTGYDAVGELEKQQKVKAKEVEIRAKEQAKLFESKQKMEAELTAKMEDADLEAALLDNVYDFAQLDKEYASNPLQNMTDKEKGDFEFKGLSQGVDLIVKDTGLPPKQAQQLMSKLKGICG